MHEFCMCEHDLKYCPRCGFVYCIECTCEWGGHNNYYWYPWYVYTYPNHIYTLTTFTSCSHSV